MLALKFNSLSHVFKYYFLIAGVSYCFLFPPVSRNVNIRSKIHLYAKFTHVNRGYCTCESTKSVTNEPRSDKALSPIRKRTRHKTRGSMLCRLHLL